MSAQAFHWMALDPQNISVISNSLEPGGLLWNALNTRLYRNEPFYQQFDTEHSIETATKKTSENKKLFFTEVEKWIDQTYTHHPMRQTNLQWKEPIQSTKCFAQIQSFSIPYEQVMTPIAYYDMLASISVIKDTDKNSLYHIERLRTFFRV